MSSALDAFTPLPPFQPSPLVPPPAAPPPPPASRVCDPDAPLPTPTEFALVPVPQLSTEPVRGVVCDRHWMWFQAATAVPRTRIVHTRVLGEDGVTRTVATEETQAPRHAVAISFDGVWMFQANRFSTSDLLVVNGMENLPSDWNEPALFDPQVALANAPPGTMSWHPGKDSFTHVVGYNTTLSDAGCASDLGSVVVVGVRCAWGQDLACMFDMKAHHLPRTLHDGDVVVAPIQRAQTHYYGVSLGPFDVLSVTLTRLGENLTYVGEGGATVSYGHGFAGRVVMLSGACPLRGFASEDDSTSAKADAIAAWSEAGGGSGSAQSVVLTNVSTSETLTSFCVDEPRGNVGIAIEADNELGPFGMPFEPKAGTTADCSDGFVGPDGRPIAMSPSAIGSLPQCNPGDNGNELKRSMPLYELRVSHNAYSSSPLATREVRPGCVSYGQWRRYEVATDGAGAANLFAEISARVSALYLRANAPPTLDEYDAMADRTKYDGAEGTTAIAGSPCDPSSPATWHFAVYLAPEALALQHGLSRSQFTLSSDLTPATRQVAAEADVEAVAATPRSSGGDGFACCGGMTHYLVSMPNAGLALRATLNVTRGALRAVYLKAGSCAVFPDDVDGQQCAGLCHMTWYVSFDRYTGLRKYKTANSTTVPSGGDFPDKRTLGDWYVSVHDAGVFGRTEYSMRIDAITPPAGNRDDACDRYGRYDCSNDLWKVPPDLRSMHSAAPAGRRAGAALAAGAPALASSLLLAAWLVGGRRGRRRSRRPCTGWADG